MTMAFSGAEEKALALLGQGLAASVVASAVGLSESRISQLLSQEGFAEAVTELRFSALQKHNARDDSLDTLEDSLISKLQGSIPLLFKPMEIVRALGVVNAAKRRGASSVQSTQSLGTVVSLTMPTKIINKYNVAVSINNQVISAGSQDLVTVQSGPLLKRLAASQSESLESKENGNESIKLERIAGPKEAEG